MVKRKALGSQMNNLRENGRGSNVLDKLLDKGFGKVFEKGDVHIFLKDGETLPVFMNDDFEEVEVKRITSNNLWYSISQGMYKMEAPVEIYDIDDRVYSSNEPQFISKKVVKTYTKDLPMPGSKSRLNGSGTKYEDYEDPNHYKPGDVRLADLSSVSENDSKW